MFNPKKPENTDTYSSEQKPGYFTRFFNTVMSSAQDRQDKKMNKNEGSSLLNNKPSHK